MAAWTVRQTRWTQRAMPSGETSAQSTSSSNGPANSMVRRATSAPCSSMISDGSTRLPRDLDMAAPCMITVPWFSSEVNGSVKPTRPRSYSTLVKKRAYSRCRMACSIPPVYWCTGIQAATRSGLNGWSGSSPV
jgi:hypothetical protein